MIATIPSPRVREDSPVRWIPAVHGGKHGAPWWKVFMELMSSEPGVKELFSNEFLAIYCRMIVMGLLKSANVR